MSTPYPLNSSNIQSSLDIYYPSLADPRPCKVNKMMTQDPFAIVMLVLLILMIPVAIILLTITARQSAMSIWDTIHHENRYRRLQISARRSILPTVAFRYSQTSPTGSMASVRATYSMAAPPRPSKPARRVERPVSPKTRSQPMERELSRMPEETSPTRTPLLEASRAFDELVDRWEEAQKPPKLDVDLRQDRESHKLIGLKAQLEVMCRD